MITKEKNSDVFDIQSFIAKATKGETPNEAGKPDLESEPTIPVDLNGSAVCGRAMGEDLHSSFRPLNEAVVADYVKNQSHLADILGGTSTEWSIKEVGDGNLNYVYILIGPKGSFVLKQVCIELIDLCFV